MKLFIVLSVCLLFVNAVRSEEAEAKKPAADWIFGFPFIGDEEMAEIAKLDQEVAKLTPDEAELKEDFLFGLVHHAAQGVLGVAHGVLHLAGAILGDEELNAKLDQMLVLKPEDFELVEIDGATEQEKKDFLFGLLHHAVHGVLGAAHGVLHLAGAILGDEKAASDFLFGLIHHAVRGVLNVGQHALNFVGHVLGDKQQATDTNFLLNLIPHALRHRVRCHWHDPGQFILGDKQQATNKDFLHGLLNRHRTACGFIPGPHNVPYLLRILGDEKSADDM